MSEIIDGVTYYTVRFLNYAATDLLGTASVASGGDATALAPKPETIEGKTFTGWNVDITHVVEDMTVRPVYEDCLTVNFYGFDKTSVLSTVTVKKGKNATPPSPEVVMHYIFIGWDKSYLNVTSNLDIYPMYRVISTNPTLRFYYVKDDKSSGDLIKTYRGVNSCSITQKLSGECTIDFSLLTRKLEEDITTGSRVEVEGLVFTIVDIKKNISGGMCYTQMTGEHVSYLLNDEDYKVEAFDMMDTPRAILTTLLSDTPLSVGQIDVADTMTLRVNTGATRRACVMQLIAQAGCEIEYYGYTIGLRKHLGNKDPIDLIKNANLQDISYSYSSNDQITNYTLSIYNKGSLSLGDELNLCFSPMRINQQSRIVGISWNPFNYKEVSITVGQYIPTLNESLYQTINTVSDITQKSAKYTVEFGEMIGNGSFYFTRAYNDRPYYQITTNDGTKGTITLTRKDGSAFSSYVGASLSGVNSTTATLLVFYCTVPDEA